MTCRKWLKRGLLLVLAYVLFNVFLANLFNPLYSRLLDVYVLDQDTNEAIPEVEITQVRTGKDGKERDSFSTTTDEAGKAKVLIVHSEQRYWVFPQIPKPSIQGRKLRVERCGYATKIVDLACEIPDISTAPRVSTLSVSLKKKE